MSRRPIVAVTAGDPCGIGPEVILKALGRIRVPSGVRFTVIGDARVFHEASRFVKRRLPAAVEFIDCPSNHRLTPGASSRLAGAASLAYLDRAIALAKAGSIDALVTAPVTKWAIQASSPNFQGHTEYLAQALRVRDVVMMFVSEELRVALLTRHLPLAAVSQAITRRLVVTTATLTHEALNIQFKTARPRLALLGINPHAGEAGRSTGEERRAIAPALRALRRHRILCAGPFAADGFFGAGAWRKYDAVIAPYHDQGLIPFKMLARDHGCQMTVGLPIARTSPDHGSALDIAGRGVADPGSMVYALNLAIRLC